MSNPESDNPFKGDAIIKHLGPALGKLVASSDGVSELLITPFVTTATFDFDALRPEVREQILAARARADEAWQEADRLEDEERQQMGLTKEQWDARFIENLRNTLEGPEPDADI